MGIIKREHIAIFWLFMITVIWGLTFPLIHNAVRHINPSEFVFFRFLIAAVIFFPGMLSIFKNSPRLIIIGGLCLGALNGAGFILQTLSLQSIDPARSAFITSSSVIFIPLLAPLFRLGKIKWTDVACTILCLLGVYILTGANLSKLGLGDLEVLFAAISFAISFLLLQWLTLRLDHYMALTFYQILCTLPFAGAGMLIEPSSFSWFAHSSVWIALLFCGFFSTVLTIFLQTRYQHEVPPTKAAIIFCFEPIFATLFSYLLINNPVHMTTYIGGTIILISLLLIDFLKPKLIR